MIKCPECDAEIKIPSDSIEGEIVTCPDCGASYELVKSAGGFNIKPAQVVGEERLWVSPSCGFGRHPPRDMPVLKAKMENTIEAARTV